MRGEVPKTSPTFCILPWIHRFTNVGGEIQVCCTSEEHHLAVPGDDGKPMNIRETYNDEVIMNSKFMRELRLEMLEGKWPQVCRRCEVTESAGGCSRRNFENERYPDLIESAIQSTGQDGSIPLMIKSVDFRLGNLCNLACRMCNPRSSYSWIKDWNKVDQDFYVPSQEQMLSFTRMDWYENPEIWARFRKQAPQLRHLHFAGGEPMLVPQMIEALRICVETGAASQIDLSYNTNITKIPEELKELWPHFMSVRLFCSIDAYGELNDVIRHPSKWSTIDRNLRELDGNFRKYGITEIMVMTTVQAYNVLQLDALYEYLGTQFDRINPIPQLINLHCPEYYLTQIFPKPIKELAKMRLLDVKERFNARFNSGELDPVHQRYLISIDEVITFMEMTDRTDLIGNFIRAAQSLDRLRNQSVFQLVPELQYLLRAPSPSPEVRPGVG